ncbi:MAG: hypothetical protein P9X26_03640 [Candidatus Stygibacter frigidus]|nr:hypothetical protein [Candidatus Stygibacter frigidus]
MRLLISFSLLLWGLLLWSEVDSELLYNNEEEALISQPELEIELIELEESPVAINFESLERLLIIPGIVPGDIKKLHEIVTGRQIKNRNELIKRGMPEDVLRLLDTYITYSQPADSKINMALMAAFNDTSFTRSKVRAKIQRGDVELGILLDRRGEESFEDVFFPFYFKYDCYPWQFLAGQYTVRWGQGILHAPAFRMGFGKTAGEFYTSSDNVIRPYTSSYENKYFSGVAGQYQQGVYRGIIYFSEAKLAVNYADSMLISSITDGSDEDEFYTLENCLGGAILREWSNWKLGLLAEGLRYSEEFEKEAGWEELENFSGWMEYKGRNLLTGGEVAYSEDKWAGSLTLKYGSSKFRQYLLFRSYQEEFPDIHGNPAARKSHFGGEEGIYYGITLKPASKWQIDMYADLYYFPEERYLIDLPSGGAEEMLNVKYGRVDNYLEIYGRYRKADKHVAIDDSSLVVNVVNGSGQITLRQKVEDIILQSRMGFRWEENTGTGEIKRGFVIYQQAGRKFGKSKIWLRITAFRGELPLYLYENNLRYSNKQVCFTGDGYRASVMLTHNWKIYKGELKYYFEHSDDGAEQGILMGISVSKK